MAAAAHTVEHHDDPAWSRLIGKLGMATGALEMQAAKLTRLADRIVNKKDATKSRAALRTATDAAATSLAEVTASMHALEGFLKLRPERRGVGGRLSNAAQKAMEDFEAAHNRVLERIQAVETAPAAQQPARRGRGAWREALASDSDADAGEDVGLMGRRDGSADARQQQHQQDHVALHVDVYDEIMHERSHEIREIAENVEVVNEIFQHIRELVQEQGEQLDEVDGNVTSAHDKTTAGRKELEKARELQQASRNKYIAGGLILLFFVIAVSTVMLRK